MMVEEKTETLVPRGFDLDVGKDIDLQCHESGAHKCNKQATFNVISLIDFFLSRSKNSSVHECFRGQKITLKNCNFLVQIQKYKHS